MRFELSFLAAAATAACAGPWPRDCPWTDAAIFDAADAFVDAWPDAAAMIARCEVLCRPGASWYSAAHRERIAGQADWPGGAMAHARVTVASDYLTPALSALPHEWAHLTKWDLDDDPCADHAAECWVDADRLIAALRD